MIIWSQITYQGAHPLKNTDSQPQLFGWLPVDYHVGEGAGVYNSFIIILWLRVWLLCLPLCLAHV